jgi:hypothetical protein
MLAAEVGKRVFPPEEADLIAELVAQDVPFYDAVVSEATLAGASRFAQEVGLLSAAADYEEIVAASLAPLWTT